MDTTQPRTAADRYGQIAAFAVVILANFLSNAVPLNGQTMPEISALYPSLFTPAGFTFAIWGVIYLGLLGYVIYQALPAQRDNAVLADISQWFVVNCAANVTWIFLWHYNLLALSLLDMLVILVSLIAIYRILHSADSAPRLSWRLLVHLPFSLYLGWICVATIANISVIQTAMNWDNAGLGAVDWTILKIALAGAIGAMMVVHRDDIAFALVVAWAAYGIASKHFDTPMVAGAASALACLALMLVVIVGSKQIWRAIAAR